MALHIKDICLIAIVGIILYLSYLNNVEYICKQSSFDNRGTILKSIIINIGNTESAKNNNDKI